MTSRRGGRQRRRRRSYLMSVLFAVALLGLAAVVFVKVLQRPAVSSARGDRTVSRSPTATTTPPTVTGSPTVPPTSPPADRSASGQVVTPSGRSVHTPQGMWWGVDSTLPISAHTIANVRHWYRDHPRPQFWGRYLSGSYGVSRRELAYARAQRIYVYLIVGDRNCSQCAGGDLCGNDRTGRQAQDDANAALGQARRLALPARTTLFKDIEQVSSCRGEPTASYLLGWYQALRGSGFRTGFYGNVHRQFFDFPVAYCHALERDPTVGSGVALAMNEDEPLIGAPRGSTGPHDAPRFAPKSPSCAPAAATKIWQYGESLTTANLTDIDQARPDTAGLLAPDGTATG